MTGKEKLYFLLDTIDDVRTITPSGQHLAISVMDDLNGKLSFIELDLLFTKLEKDEKVLKILQNPNRVKNAILQEYSQYQLMDDGRYHPELLSAFDNYFLRIQHEPEYQKFTSRRPTPKLDYETEVNSSPGDKVVSSNFGKRKVSTEVLVSDLQTKYLEIQNEKNDNKFYLEVASYGKYLNDNDILQQPFAQLYCESQNQIANSKKAWREFFEKWKVLAKDLIETADINEVKDDGPLQNEIEEVRGLLNQPDPQFNDDELPRYFSSYREIILRFNRLGKGRVITRRHLDEDGNIKLHLEFNKVEMEWNKFKNAREISTWWAHCQISRLAGGVLGSEDKKHYSKNDDVINELYRWEFEKISRGNSSSLIFLKRTKFEEWITRLHNYLIPRLKEVPGNHGTNADSEKTLEKISGLPNKREMAKEVVRLKKICGLGKKEAKLLVILSNFVPKKTRELTNDIPTKDYKHLKGALAKKIKREAWIIETNKGEGFNPDSFYTLVRTPLVNN